MAIKVSAGATTGSGPGDVAVPTRYAHLVHKGHRVVNRGPNPIIVPPRPFLADAWAAKGGLQALETFKKELQVEVSASVARAAKRSGP